LIQENDCALLFHSSNVYLLANNHIVTIANNLINDENSIKIASLDSTDNLYKLLPHNPSIHYSHVSKTSTIWRYSTVNFKDLPDCANFWHCALGHADADAMINFFESNTLPIDSNPMLTFGNIRKFFPTVCPDCPIGNLQAKPPPFVPVIDDTLGNGLMSPGGLSKLSKGTCILSQLSAQLLVLFFPNWQNPDSVLLTTWRPSDSLL
jgi:hypothetical protein